MDELSGRTTGRLRCIRPDTAHAMTEGRHSWYYDTLSTPHLPLDPITISDDYGPAGAAGAWASPPHPPGPQDLSGTTGRTEQRTPPPNPLGPQYLSGTTGRQELHSESRRTNNCYCATAPLDWQTYNAGYGDRGPVIVATQAIYLYEGCVLD
jgi:hypothetical protein